MIEETIYSKIESPLSNFNNLIYQLAGELNEIYYSNEKSNLNLLLVRNELIFDNKYILLFGFIKIGMNKFGEFCFKFSGDINPKRMELVSKSLYNKQQLNNIYNKYIFILTTTIKNYDETISQNYVETIYKELTDKNFIENQKNEIKYYLIPYKSKIKHLFDNDKTLEKLFTKFEYVICFDKKISYHYYLYRVLSSNLNQSKSIDNIRYLEKECISNGTIQINNLWQFLKSLFYYGTI
ncbi:hypothetical protein M0Q97_10695 [Candidatus Dojkabacteria bacterium]|jgi:hypothetical protein|nr:hypothetical protein [Candidatus Dojkabacteria bacterium]